MRRELQLLATERSVGKSTQALAWVSHGERTGGYPGWSRVLVVSYQQTWDHLRRDYWGRLPDFDHRVYLLRDWAGVRGLRFDVEVCIDDLEAAIRTADLRHLPGRLVAATMTTEPWEPHVFREAPRLVPPPLAPRG